LKWPDGSTQFLNKHIYSLTKFNFRAKGEALLALGREEESVHCFDKALALTTEGELLHIQILRKRAYVLQFNLRRKEEALRDLNSVLKYNPFDKDARRKKGLILRDLQYYEEALKFYEGTLSMFPQDYETYLQKGDVLMKLKRYSEALDIYEKAQFLKEPLFGNLDIHSRQTLYVLLKIDELKKLVEE